MVRLKYLDTYALIEISRGNPKFTKYYNDDFITSDLTLGEFYGIILKNFNEDTARYWLKKLRLYSEEVYLDVIIDAIKFRRENKKVKFSFFDALGYEHSRSRGALFVTGDSDFKGFKEVEFVKK